ncbi:MAG: DUF1349 domain-containing protein [Desulfobulbaceae bacterium]|nr:DUF1349 domain-containing protein [Desulfobulbaceae bacterium]
MGTNFHTAPTTATKWKPADVEAFLSTLDQAITYGKNVIVHCDGLVTYNKTGKLAWASTLRITFNRADGKAVQNTVAAGSITLADGEFAYLDLNETDATALTMAKAAVTTGAASNFIAYNRLVLGYRNAASDEFFPVNLHLAIEPGFNDDFDEDPVTTTGLTWGYKAGLFRNDNAVYSKAAGTVALTDAATNYVEIDVSTQTLVKNTTGFTAGDIPIREVVCAGGAQTGSADKRTALNVGGAGGASTFLGLTDTPGSYAGQAGKVPVVNTGETALEFVGVPSAVAKAYPDFLTSAKAAADSGDDEFAAASLTGWTAVAGSSGTVNFLGAADVGIYDLATRAGTLLIQARNNNVQLRKDFEIPDGACEIMPVSLTALLESTGSGVGIADNELNIGLYLNDNDISPTSGNYAALLMDCAASAIQLLAIDNTSQRGTTGVTTDVLNVPLGQTVFLRITRSGTTYYYHYSLDGRGWVAMGKSAIGSALTNIWIGVTASAGFTDPVPIISIPWVRQGLSSLDPWPWTAASEALLAPLNFNARTGGAFGALDSYNTTGMANGQPAQVRDSLGVHDYRFNSTSTDTEDGLLRVAPDTGSGRWHLVGTTTHIGALVSKVSANQSITIGTFTPVTFNTENEDVGGFWVVGSPSRLTIPKGVTRVKMEANVAWATGGTAYVIMTIYKNGTALSPTPWQRDYAVGEDEHNISTYEIPVVAGDYLELVVYVTVTKNVVGSAAPTRTWMSINAIEFA